MYLSQNLKYLREQKGLNQRDLAKLLGVSNGAIGMWETGEREPNIEMIVRLAEYFGVTLDDLIRKDLRPVAPIHVTNIRCLRIKHEMKQEDMAKFLRVSKASYCKYENGIIDIGIEKLLRLADFFGVTLDELVKQDLSKEK